ncbi:hypothetical protein TWF694_005860 [Orbilia ellipsospora]|uniref:Uncharacterized protein n=1 Tax=Orbilia ellipsospora TaxID=2528407 RepID=A0AAV9WSB3_9PEZI
MRFVVGALALLSIFQSTTAQSAACSCSCTLDGCISALQGTFAFPSQATVDDCRLYLWTHSNYAKTTIRLTKYVTSATVTDTISATVTVTVSGGTTSTTTESDFTTITTTVTSGTTPLAGDVNTITSLVTAKRVVKRQGNSIPDYAAVCGDAAGYSSGCNCIGVPFDGTTYIEVAAVTETVTSTVAFTHIQYAVQTSTVSQGSNVVQTQTTASTSISIIDIPQFTSIALQLTNDEANSDFKGYYLSVGSDSSVVLTSNPGSAGIYLANSSLNITYNGNLPFVADTTSQNAQMYNQASSATEVQSNCWIDADYFFYCTGQGPLTRTYFGAANSTGAVQFFSWAGEIYNTGATGPLVIKAVPYPAADADTLPPAGAKAIQIRASSATSNGAFASKYWTTTTDSSPYARVAFGTAANAITFLADPTTGHFLDQVNTPFIANQISVIEQFYLAFPGAPKDIISCSVAFSDMSVSCVRTLYPGGQFWAVATNSTNNGFVGIYNETDNAAVRAGNPDWVLPITLEAVLVSS